MYLKAKYNNIKDLGDYLVNKSSDIDNNLNEVKNLLNELGKYWDGDNYETFKIKYLNYIKKANVTSIELNALGHAIKKAGIIYSLVNNDFLKKVEQVEEK